VSKSFISYLCYLSHLGGLMARNKIDRSNLGEKPFKIFNELEIENEIEKGNAKPSYFYYPLANFSSVPIYRNGIEKMNIFWPKHWWQSTRVVEVYNSKENISCQKTLKCWQVISLRNKFYPNDWNILQSVIISFKYYLKEDGVKIDTLEAADAFREFKKRITDPFLRFQLEFRLGYIEWSNDTDPKVLKNPNTEYL